MKYTEIVADSNNFRDIQLLRYILRGIYHELNTIDDSKYNGEVSRRMSINAKNSLVVHATDKNWKRKINKILLNKMQVIKELVTVN